MKTIETTYNVTEGINTLYGYKKINVLRFKFQSFAVKHLQSLNVIKRKNICAGGAAITRNLR